jgi:hypothetical protein
MPTSTLPSARRQSSKDNIITQTKVERNRESKGDAMLQNHDDNSILEKGEGRREVGADTVVRI